MDLALLLPKFGMLQMLDEKDPNKWYVDITIKDAETERQSRLAVCLMMSASALQTKTGTRRWEKGRSKHTPSPQETNYADGILCSCG